MSLLLLMVIHEASEFLLTVSIFGTHMTKFT